jgi:hypothetical protein
MSAHAMRPYQSELVQNFLSAIGNLVSVERAKIIASQTEQQVIEGLDAIQTSNGLYLTPQDIPQSVAGRVVHDSVNAHLTKVQSEQLAQVALSEVSRLELETKQKFLHKKVIITVNKDCKDAVDAVLDDKNTGEIRVTPYNGKKIKGTIEDLSFENNVIIIKPTLTAKFITPNRHFFHVYVINTQTMTANIHLQLA